MIRKYIVANLSDLKDFISINVCGCLITRALDTVINIGN